MFQVKSPSTTVKYAKLQDIETYIGATYPGTVTSVGLATDDGTGSPMAAFTITNSPVTSSGTLTLGITGGSPGQFLQQDGTWASVPGTYTWDVTDGSTSATVASGDAVTFTTGSSGTSAGANDAISISQATRTVTVVSNAFAGGANVGHVPSGGTAGNFLQGDGTWAAAGGSGVAPTKQLFTTGGTTYTLSATPSTSDDVLVYVSGVYQSVGDFTFAAGPPAVVTLTSTVPSGTKVEVVSFV